MIKKNNILMMANDIVNVRSEEKERQYWPFEESMKKAAQIATALCWKEISDKDMYLIMVAMKLSRESHTHKEDNLLDACAYLWALNNTYD